MADINKSALLVLNEDQTKFLVTRKSDKTVPHWLMPGGSIEEGESVEEALVREVKEELDCELALESLEHVGDYEAPAAGRPGQFVNIKLYKGEFEGEPKPSSEIIEFGWIGKNDTEDPIVSEIIGTKIMPDLIERNILK